MTNPEERNSRSEDTEHPERPAQTSQREQVVPAAGESKDAGRGKAMKGLFWYGLARLLLFFVLFFVLIGVIYLIGAQIPAAITAVFALIIAMPLSVFVFPKLRVEANESVAAWAANRRAHKAYIAQQIKDREEN